MRPLGPVAEDALGVGEKGLGRFAVAEGVDEAAECAGGTGLSGDSHSGLSLFFAVLVDGDCLDDQAAPVGVRQGAPIGVAW